MPINQKISGETFNAGYENKSVLELANTVKECFKGKI